MCRKLVKRAFVGRCRHWRRARTDASQPSLVIIAIGARSEVVEGVIVEDNCVISMGVYIGQSTKIYDRTTGEVTYGRIPERFGGGLGQSAQCGWHIQPVLR